MRLAVHAALMHAARPETSFCIGIKAKAAIRFQLGLGALLRIRRLLPRQTGFLGHRQLQGSQQAQ